MKMEANRRLFWFLKDGTRLDLEKQEDLDLYVQQVLSHGTSRDVRQLLAAISPISFGKSFQRVGRFLSRDVKNFWEHYLVLH